MLKRNMILGDTSTGLCCMNSDEYIERYGIFKYMDRLETNRAAKYRSEYELSKALNDDARSPQFTFDACPSPDPRKEKEKYLRNNNIRKCVYDKLHIKYEVLDDYDNSIKLIAQFEKEWNALPNDTNGEHMDDKQIKAWLEEWQMKFL